MKSAVSIILLSASLLFFGACPTMDPLKDLPQTEYDQALKYRARIAKLDFSQYATDEFNAGETAFQAGELNMKKDNLAAKKSLDEANGAYRIVMHKGIAALRKQKDVDIAASREKADTLKAAVAAAQEYKDAQAAYDQAAALADNENWEEAEPLFTQAQQKYDAAYDAAKAKKENADTQFDKTKQLLDELRATQGLPPTPPAPDAGTK